MSSKRKWAHLSGLGIVCLCLWRLLSLLDNPEWAPVGKDKDASLVRLVIDPTQDSRGWLLDPLKAAAQAGLSGGAVECKSVHAGEVRVGAVRANHRHHYCNETFVIWNANALYRVENVDVDKGYAQAVIGGGDVVICTASAGQAHAIVNIDKHKTLYLLACQDGVFRPENPMTDFKIWPDL